MPDDVGLTANHTVSMESYDFHTDLLHCISTVTDHAVPNSDYEVHAHYHEFEIYYFLEGDLSFAFEGQRLPVQNGDMIIIAAGCLHRPIIRHSCRYCRKRLLFRQELFRRLQTADMEFYHDLLKRKILFLPNASVVSCGLDQLFEDIVRYAESKTAEDSFCAMISLFSLLIKAKAHSREPAGNADPIHNEKALALLQYIDQHLTEELNYTSLAEHFSMTDKNLYKFFKRETGFTLSDYINERRIVLAQSLLNAGACAAEAAESVGYIDYSVFYRNFVKRLGVSPAKYQRDHRKNTCNTPSHSL